MARTIPQGVVQAVAEEDSRCLIRVRGAARRKNNGRKTTYILYTYIRLIDRGRKSKTLNLYNIRLIGRGDMLNNNS